MRSRSQKVSLQSGSETKVRNPKSYLTAHAILDRSSEWKYLAFPPCERKLPVEYVITNIEELVSTIRWCSGVIIVDDDEC